MAESLEWLALRGSSCGSVSASASALRRARAHRGALDLGHAEASTRPNLRRRRARCVLELLLGAEQPVEDHLARVLRNCEDQPYADHEQHQHPPPAVSFAPPALAPDLL